VHWTDGSIRQGPSDSGNTYRKWLLCRVAAIVSCVGIKFDDCPIARAIDCRTMPRSASSSRGFDIGHSLEFRSLEILSKFNLVDDADNRSVDRGGFPSERFACRFTLEHDQHRLADAGPDGIDGQKRDPSGLPVRSDRLDEQKLRPLELPVFPGRDDCAEDLC
jgi:hypothetical protein